MIYIFTSEDIENISLTVFFSISLFNIYLTNRLKENLTLQKHCTKWVFLLQHLYIYVKMFQLLVLSSTSWNMSRSNKYLELKLGFNCEAFTVVTPVIL
jgi:hypothetical protein